METILSHGNHRHKIIIKPYNKKIYKIGIVKDVLTKAKKNMGGHKVRLEDGTIGRVVAK
jgi:uncharacterized repeat protein (TIGR03833 family)